MSSTPSSEQRRPWYLHPVGVVLTALLTGFIGIGLLVTAVTETENRVVSLVIGLFMSSVSLMLWLSLGQDRDPWSMTELDGRPAWRVRLGQRRTALAGVTAVCVVAGLGLALGAVLGGSVGLAVVLGLLAAFMLAVGVSLALAVVRDPSFVIGVDRLVHDGAGARVELAWDEVGTIEYAHMGTRWASMRFSALTTATSYSARSKPTLLPLDRIPPQPGIEVRLVQLPDVPRLLNLLRELELGGRATRESLISRGLPADSGRWAA